MEDSRVFFRPFGLIKTSSVPRLAPPGQAQGRPWLHSSRRFAAAGMHSDSLGQTSFATASALAAIRITLGHAALVNTSLLSFSPVSGLRDLVRRWKLR